MSNTKMSNTKMSNTDVKASTQGASTQGASTQGADNVQRHTPIITYELVSFDKSKENPISFEEVNLNVINTLLYLNKTRVCTNTYTPEPYIRANVKYNYNYQALHDMPSSSSIEFTLPDFQILHKDWLDHVTNYTIEDIDSAQCHFHHPFCNQDNVVTIIANAVKLTSDIRENSWKPGAYQITQYEAAEMAAQKMGIPENFVQLIDILLSASWNDSLLWAYEVLDSSK